MLLPRTLQIEALYDAFTSRSSRSFLGLRTGVTINEPVTQVAKSVFDFKTFQQVRDDALGAATCMALDLKMERRQFFGICCANCYDWLLFEFACCFNDVPLVGINTNWNPDVLAHVINISEVVCIACSADVVAIFQALQPSCPSLLSLVVINYDPLKPLPPCSPQHPLNIFIWHASLRRLRLHHSPLSSDPLQTSPFVESTRTTVHTLTCVGMPDFTLRKLRGQVPELDQKDIHCLLFTSGTSGAPKGVEVTKNRWYLDNKDGGIMSNHSNPAFLTYNSWSHGADRGNIWMSLFIGARVGIGRELGRDCSHQELLCDLAGIQPTCFFAFSCVWSELYAVFNQQLENITISQASEMLENQTPAVYLSSVCPQEHHHVLSEFQVALQNQNVVSKLALSVISPTASLELSTMSPEAVQALQQLRQSKHTFVRKAAEIMGSRDLLLANWFQRMGGRVVAAVTGGGHTSDEVLSWMQAVFGFKTTCYKEQDRIWKNSYGSSEFPGISLNGAVADSIELEIVPIFDEDGKCVSDPGDVQNKTGRGEIRVKHKDKSLCVRYYRNPEATAAAFRDGWYYTGDVGEWAVDADDQFVKTSGGKRLLVIVDRVKNLCELYIDGDSKWVDPSRLELELFSAAPCVKQVCLVCDRNQPQMVALVVPSDGELQRLRPSGDRVLADENVESNSEFAAYLLQQLISFAHTQATASGRQLLAFELPCAVVVCAQPWTEENGLLTANGKLKRGDLKKRLQKRMEDAYFNAFNASQTPPQVSLNATHTEVARIFPCITATVLVPSPVFDRDCVRKVENGRFHMDDVGIIAFRVNDSVKFASGTLPNGISSDRVYVVSSISLTYPYFFKVREFTTNGQLLEVVVSDTKTPFTVHHAISLPAPLSSCIEQLGRLTGTGFIQSKLPAEAIHRGRIKNDISMLPFIEGSVETRDFIAFEFKGADDATTAEANEVLSRLKTLVQTYRHCAESWVQDIAKIRLDAHNSEIEQLNGVNVEVDAKFFKFMWGNEDATAGTDFADGNHSFVENLENLLICLVARVEKIKVIRENTKAIKSQELPSKEEFMRKYNLEADTLRVLAPRFGLEIPYEIQYIKWWTKVSDQNDVGMRQAMQDSQMLSNSLGDIVVSCCVTGMVIQENENGAGKPRYNNLDDGTKQCSVEGYTLVQSVISFVTNLRITHDEVAEHMWAMLNRCSLFHPFMPQNSVSRAWCLEYNSSYHLVQSCISSGSTISISSEFSCTVEAIKAMIQNGKGIPREQQRLFFDGKLLADDRTLADYGVQPHSTIVLRVPDGTQRFVSIDNQKYIYPDTPAGRIYRAFRAFANRPALGIPDADVMKTHDILGSIHFRRSAFADALRIDLTPNRGYHWISFSDLGRTASLVAKVLRGMQILRGSFVAISGYNDIEWAACDFACAMSGLVSVGIHSTFNSEEALFALQNSGCVALLTTADFVLDNDDRGMDKTFWSVQSVLALAKKKQQLAVLKLSQIFLTDAHSTISSTDFSEIDAPVKIHSMVDMLSEPFKYHNISIEHPDLQPEGGLDAIFTILHTGGSSGLPKQVVVKARGFARDIGEMSLVLPLVTCSYIPLSHSSDRYKLWEFCCRGGSVAFAFYEASHWLDHERLKKSQSLDAGPLESAEFNNVDSLLRQLQDVSVTAMSCPPNILTGVYRMYRRWQAGGATEEEACERVRQLFGDRLKNIATGGAPTPANVMSAVPRWFPYASFVDSFGTTECGAISANGKQLTEKGVKLKVRTPIFICSNIVSGELLVCSPSMSAGYLNDETRTNESFMELSRETSMIFPPVSDQDVDLKWYATGDVVEVTFDEFAHRNQALGDAWAKEIVIKGRMSAQVKLSSGSAVSPDVLERVYASSPLFSDIYIDARSNSNSIVAIVIPAASLSGIKGSDGLQLFNFDAVCAKDFFTLEQGFRNVVSSEFYSRRRQFIDVAISECRSIASRCRLAPHEIPVAFYVENEPWSVQNRMLNSNLKKNRKMFQQRYESTLRSLHAPYVSVSLPMIPEDKLPGSLESLALRGDSWAVLCTGGSSSNQYGTIGKPWKNVHGDKSHLDVVNTAYKALSKLIGRDRIIVIGTFKTHLDFLEGAAQSGFPPFTDKMDNETSMAHWAEKLIEFKDEFQDILQHCDYDGEHVNPSTIIDVISGRQVHFPTPVAGRVIPYSEGVRSLFFYIHTHGWSYAIPQHCPTACDLCVAMGNSNLMLPEEHPKNVGHDHSSLRTREWYLSMPHPGDPRDFGSVVLPAEGKPCLDPYDRRLKSFVTQMVSGIFSLSEIDGSFPPLYSKYTWRDQTSGVKIKKHQISWDPPSDPTYPFQSRTLHHIKSSLPVFMNMLTRETARSRPDATTQDATARLPEGWVEYVLYQNSDSTASTWVINPVTSNCPPHLFLHDSQTADSDAPFILEFSVWQHFFVGLKMAIQQSPFTKFVLCFDACGSGGLAKFLNDQSYEKHAQVASWPVAIIASSGEQTLTKPIYSRLFAYLEAAFRQPLSPMTEECVTPISRSRVEAGTPLRRFFSEIMDTVRTKDSPAEHKPSGLRLGDQGIVLASGSASGIEAADLRTIFFNEKRS